MSIREKWREAYREQKELEQAKAKEVVPIVKPQRKPKTTRLGFVRRSVEDVPAWIGWQRMLTYYNGSPSQLHKNIFTTIFETGGRVSEVIELKPDMFVWNDEAIKVVGMIVKKHRKHKRRDFLIKIEDNLLAKDLISFVSSCKTKFLFPKGEPFTGRIIFDQHTSTTRIYLKVLEISGDLWPHYLRAQRASFNVFVRKMNLFQLMDWFKWKGTDTPAHYINQTLEGMAKQMGIKNIPS